MFRNNEKITSSSVVDLPLLDQGPQGPVDGGRGVPAEAEAGELGGEPLDDVGHVGGGPGLSVLEENAADGIL